MSTPKIITARRLADGRVTHFHRPSYRDIELNFLATEGTQFDPVERGAVNGGVPLVWPVKVTADARA